jgi:hypothetical protein
LKPEKYYSFAKITQVGSELNIIPLSRVKGVTNTITEIDKHIYIHAIYF